MDPNFVRAKICSAIEDHKRTRTLRPSEVLYTFHEDYHDIVLDVITTMLMEERIWLTRTQIIWRVTVVDLPHASPRGQYWSRWWDIKRNLVEDFSKKSAKDH